MIGNDLQSAVAKPKKPDELKLNRRSYTISALLEARLDAVTAMIVVDKTDLVRACILKALPDFEADPSLVYAILKAAESPLPTSSIELEER